MWTFRLLGSEFEAPGSEFGVTFLNVVRDNSSCFLLNVVRDNSSCFLLDPPDI